MTRPLVSCLMATHGRYTRTCESLGCFLDQDYPERELVILNDHPVPLMFDHPLVRVVNETGFPTLGHVRNRLLELACGRFFIEWDDDDLHLPHCLSQSVQMIGNHSAWKPTFSWFMNGDNISLASNNLEGSIIWVTEAVRAIGYNNTAGTEHDPLLTHIQIARDDVGASTAFVYRWGDGGWHLSGSIGNNTDEERTRTWRKRNQDVRLEVPLVPANLTMHWTCLDKVKKELFPDFKG